MEEINISFVPNEEESRDICNAALKNEKNGARSIVIAALATLLIADSVYAVINQKSVLPQNVLIIAGGVACFLYVFFIRKRLIMKNAAESFKNAEFFVCIGNEMVTERLLSAETVIDKSEICTVTESKEYLVIEYSKENKKKQLLLPKRAFKDGEIENAVRLLSGKEGITDE